MRTQRDTHALEHAGLRIPLCRIDHEAGIIVDFVLDAVRIGERAPAIAVDRGGPIAAAVGIELVNGHDLSRFLTGGPIVVLIAPPGRDVRAERLALVLWVGAWARIHVKNADFEDVALFGAADSDRSGHNVHAVTSAGAIRGIHRSSAPPVDILLILGPEIDAFGTGIAFDHSLRIVPGLVRKTFDGGVIAGLAFE